jgi:hypothetical protein
MSEIIEMPAKVTECVNEFIKTHGGNRVKVSTDADAEAYSLEVFEALGVNNPEVDTHVKNISSDILEFCDNDSIGLPELVNITAAYAVKNNLVP